MRAGRRVRSIREGVRRTYYYEFAIATDVFDRGVAVPDGRVDETRPSRTRPISLLRTVPGANVLFISGSGAKALRSIHRMALFDDQCKEINLHVRHVAQLLVNWYAFFVTGNLIALGWFITSDSTKVLITTSVLWTVITAFLVVNILGICGLQAARRYFIGEHRRLQALLESNSPYESASALLHISPIPTALYCRAVVLMSASLVAIFSTWLALGLLRTVNTSSQSSRHMSHAGRSAPSK